MKRCGNFRAAIADKTGAFGKLIAKPDNQEQRNTDIGCRHAAPVNGVFQERFVVLAEIIRHRTKAKIGPSGKEPGTIRQIVDIAALQHVAKAETIVADGDAQPGDKAGHPRGIQQPQVNGLVAKH